MKASNLGLWLIGAAALYFIWIIRDMDAPAAGSAGKGSSMAAVQASTLPVLVEFYADWCGPCKAVAPIVEEFAQEVAGRAKVIRINVDDNRADAEAYQIRGIPTFIAFKDGQEIRRTSGAIPKAAMKELLGL